MIEAIRGLRHCAQFGGLLATGPGTRGGLHPRSDIPFCRPGYKRDSASHNGSNVKGRTPAQPTKARRLGGLRFLAILASTAALSPTLHALDPGKSIFQFNCQNWSRANGIPASNISSISQSSDGYIWLGSDRGLIRYDGAEFKACPTEEGAIGGQAVKAVSRGTDGRLWLTLSSGGFGNFDGQKFKSMGTARGRTDGPFVNAILAAKDGDVWIGSTEGWGRMVNGRFPDADEQGRLASVSCLSEDATGTIWIGTASNGLFFWTAGKLHPFADPELKKTKILSVVTGPGAEVWVATTKGLHRYDSHFRLVETLFGASRVNALLVDSQGLVWAGGDGLGVGRYQEGKFTMLCGKDGLGGDNVSAIFEDAEGSLWIGTNAGLSQLSDVKFPVYSAKEGLSASTTYAVSASSRGGLWMGTGTGITYFDGRIPKNIRISENPSKNMVLHIKETRGGDVVYSDNARNIGVLSGGAPTLVIPTASWPQALAEDGTGVLAGIAFQLVRIEDGKIHPFALPGTAPEFTWIFSVCPAKDGSIWVGTNRGITKVKGQTVRDWSTRDGLITNRVDCVTEDDDGAIWASTTWGVIRIKDDKLTMITQADGLSDDRVFAVIPDDLGYLWLNSVRGLQRISRKNVDDFAEGRAQRVDCRTFDGGESIRFADRGNQSYSGCKTTDGRIWFPNSRGVIMVDPARYFTNPAPPGVTVDRVAVDGHDYTDRADTSVQAGESGVRFFFSARGYIAPKKIRVRYKLEHYDNDWIDAGDSRSVVYDHLTPERYDFHVQAANEDGVWNATGDSFKIELLPPFYRRPWFYCLALLSVPCGATCLFEFKARRIRARQAELLSQNELLESMVENRTRQLDRSLSVLTATIESTPDGVLAIQMSNDAAIWNTPLVRMWAIPDEILNRKVGGPILDYMAGLVVGDETFRLWLKASLSAPESESLEAVDLRDGKIFEVHRRPQCLDGRSSGIVLHFRDVTDRRRIEGALRSSEQRFKAIFEQAAVGVAQIDIATGRFVQINQHLCEIMGRSRIEMERLTLAEITFPQELDMHLEKMRLLRLGLARESTREGRFLRKDGSVIWVNMTVSSMWQPGETPDFVIAVAQDVSDRKRLEDQIRQSQKMDAIGTLAGGIAHDFNNILSIIKGYTDLADLEIGKDAEAHQHLATIRLATVRATDLVRQILTFSRQQPHERKPISLPSIVAETLKLLRASIPATIEFSQVFAPDVPTVLADATQIHQIMMNLGTNAWQAMRDRPGKLEVVLERYVIGAENGALQPRLSPGVYARLSVSDTGCGMDQATLGRIFEPFFTTKLPGEGTGLGLAVVHGIMESHQGAITAYSSPGEGTVFRLYFPAFVGTASAEGAREGLVPRGRGERVLLVDDEELLARMGGLTLKTLGYEVETATQPELALKMFTADPGRYALVLTDHSMPVMNGLVLAKRLKEIRPELPIILLTGNNLSLTPDKLDSVGIAQVLLKPNSITTLGTAVQRALEVGTPPLGNGASPPKDVG